MGRMEEQAREQNVHEAVQVHFRGEQGAGGGGDDGACPEQDEDAGGRMVNKQMCFYLNKKHQATPPTPTDPAVKIEQNKEFTVYVHKFGGYAMSDSVNLREARRFAEVLRNAGEEVD